MNKFLILLFLFIFGCIQEESWNPCNAKDPDSTCYMPPPEATVNSYNPHSIIISDSIMNVNENVESIELIRITDGVSFDSIFTIPILNNTYSYIDSVELNKSYKYKLLYNGFYDDESDSDTTNEIYHKFNGVQDFMINIISDAEVNVEWTYDYFSNFTDLTKDSIKFELSKYQLGNINPLDTTKISLSFPINEESNKFIYKDISVSQDDQLQYEIFIKDNNLISETVTTEIDTINFPQCNINHYIPLNSHTIYLKWECDYVIENLSRVKLTNQFNEEIFDIVDTGSYGYYKDDLNDYIELVSNELPNLDNLANLDVIYTLTWWGEGGESKSITKTLNTFPVHHMEYVPSLNSFNFGDFEEYQNDTTIFNQTKAFYIDKYEVNDYLYQNPDDNPFNKWIYQPIVGGASFEDANSFCELRTDRYQTLFPNINLNFELPNELDWEIAASAKYDDLIYSENHQSFIATFSSKYIYPEVVANGQINCFYANIQSCYNETTEIGFFTELNDQIDSSSPSKIYDCSGNVKEWVTKYFTHSDNREILRGGDYNSNPNDVKSTSFIYEFPETQHNSIGFRTIIDASDYLESIRN